MKRFGKISKALAAALAFVFTALCLSGCGAGSTDAVMKELPGDALSFDDSRGVSVHDPSVFKGEDGRYYITGSHIASAVSDDLVNWSTISTGVFDSNTTLVREGRTLRESYEKAFKWCDGAQRLWEKSEDEWETNVWASDIIYNRDMGKYCYYACSSVWGSTASVIWMAVSDSPTGTFDFVDTMIYSGFSSRETPLGAPKNQLHYSFTNIGELIENGTFSEEEVKSAPWFDDEGNYDCTYGKYPNAIDPAPFYAENGELWLAYGSYSGGIYVMPLIEETGMPDYAAMRGADGYDIYFGKQISRTNGETANTGEGPFIIYDKQSGYYYFFLSYGGLNALDGYDIRLYRSESPDGPYVDAAGNDAADMKSTGTKLIGNYRFSFDETAKLSPGHSSCLIDDDGSIYQVFHQRYDDGEGAFHNVQVHRLFRTQNGWLTMSPLPYGGEDAAAAEAGELGGEYEALIFDCATQKTDSWEKVSDIITAAGEAELDGSILRIGENETELELSDGGYFEFSLANEHFYGAAVKLSGGESGGETIILSAVSDKNRSFWAVRS